MSSTGFDDADPTVRHPVTEHNGRLRKAAPFVITAFCALASVGHGAIPDNDNFATRIALDNVKSSVGSNFAGLVAELRSMADTWRQAGGDPAGIGLADFLRDVDLEVNDLYKSDGWTWSRLRREAGLPTLPIGADERRLSRAIPRLLHLDDPGCLALYKRAVMVSCRTAISIPTAFLAAR